MCVGAGVGVLLKLHYPTCMNSCSLTHTAAQQHNSTAAGVMVSGVRMQLRRAQESAVTVSLSGSGKAFGAAGGVAVLSSGCIARHATRSHATCCCCC
jgi:hypothetical protein